MGGTLCPPGRCRSDCLYNQMIFATGDLLGHIIERWQIGKTHPCQASLPGFRNRVASVKFRKAVGLERGGEVVVELDGREIRIRTVDEVVGRAQTLTRRLLGDNPDASLDAFLAERRREAARE